MRKFRVFSIFCLLLWTSAAFSQDPRVQSLSQKSLKTFHLPNVEKFKLSNGMQVYFSEDHELPTLQLFAFIRGGAVFDPPHKTGVAGLVGTLLRVGGTLQKTPGQVDEILEDRGAELETSMTHEYGSARLRCLKEDADLMSALFFEILSSPRFDKTQFELARSRQIEAIKRQDDEAERIALREFPKLLYGPKSPWAASPTAQTLQSINMGDLKDFYGRFFHPENVVIAVGGDLKKEEVIELLEKSSANWSKGSAVVPPLPPVEKVNSKGVYVINKKGGQSTIFMGHFGDQRFNPDKFALILMDYLLGGDIFSSRLGEEIRSSRGLAYGVYSHFGLETKMGLFYVMAQTKTESTVQVVELAWQIIRDFHDGKHLSESSLQFAKEAILNRLINEWEPHFNYVKERARLGFLGYPEDYLQTYPQSIRKVTLDDVKKVGQKYLFPDALKVLIIGDEVKMEKDLKKLGEVKMLPLTQ